MQSSSLTPLSSDDPVFIPDGTVPIQTGTVGFDQGSLPVFFGGSRAYDLWSSATVGEVTQRVHSLAEESFFTQQTPDHGIFGSDNERVAQRMLENNSERSEAIFKVLGEINGSLRIFSKMLPRLMMEDALLREENGCLWRENSRLKEENEHLKNACEESRRRLFELSHRPWCFQRIGILPPPYLSNPSYVPAVTPFAPPQPPSSLLPPNPDET